MPRDRRSYDAAYYEKNKERTSIERAAYRNENKEHIAAYGVEYRENNRRQLSAKRAAYYQKNKERIAAYRTKNKDHIAAQGAAYRQKNKQSLAAYNAKRYQTLLNQFYDDYGLKKKGHEHSVCTCCKEADLMMFGTLSHIDGSGKHHRETTNGSRTKMLREAIAVYDPTRFAAECFNCNLAAVRNNGICPHKLSQQKK